MKTKLILVAALGFIFAVQSFAQTDSIVVFPPVQLKPHPPKMKKPLPLKRDGEKTVIIIDNGKVTVNGKPVEDFKGDLGDLRILNGVSPHAFSFSGPMTLNGFAFSSNKAMLGVTTEKDEKGAKVTAVTKGSAAEKAGLKEGDIITKVDTITINNPDDLHDAIGKYKPDDNVTITYLRGETNMANSVTAKLEKNKEPQAFTLGSRDYQDFSKNFNDQFKGYNDQFRNFNFSVSPKPRLGLQVQDMEEGDGVKVTDVNDDSPAAKAGLKENDIITQINGDDIKTVDDVRTKIKGLKEGDTYEIKYKRDGKVQSVKIKIPKRLKTADL